ncbi:hypothetical protein ACRAWF_16975 [Streptomyces sp. L7]
MTSSPSYGSSPRTAGGGVGTIASPKHLEGRAVQYPGAEAREVYSGLFFAILVGAVSRLGGWYSIARHFLERRSQPARALIAALGALIALALSSRAPSPESAGARCPSWTPFSPSPS